MKKMLCCIVIVFLSMTFSLSLSAAKPQGSALSYLPKMPTGDAISLGLETSPEYSRSSWAVNTLTSEQITDVSDIKYGASIIGATGLERTVRGATDGVWSKGNTGVVLENGKKAGGALSWYPSGQKYNVQGQVSQSDSIYISLLTYNFGKKMRFDAFLFMSTNLNSFPQAGDVYVSDDGISWTLMGSWDRCALRLEGKDYQNLGQLSDVLNDYSDNSVGWSLDGAVAQYIRFAFTKGNGLSTGNGTYDGFANPDTSAINFRELVVFGTDYESPASSNTTAPDTTESLTTDSDTSSTEDLSTTSEDTGNRSKKSANIITCLLILVIFLATITTVILTRKFKKGH
ncbi:MAG: hypothetical protein GX303_07260 [Clostridiales bacterium]|nr:hypothetical protein [Clostridiales bacterium]